LGAVQKRSGKIGTIEHRFEEVRAVQIRTRQIRPAQVRAPEIGTPKVGPRYRQACLGRALDRFSALVTSASDRHRLTYYPAILPAKSVIPLAGSPVRCRVKQLQILSDMPRASSSLLFDFREGRPRRSDQLR
jgi:hypothetical protein